MPQPNESSMMQAQANALQRRTMHAQSAMLSTAAPFSKDYGSISVPNPNYMPAGGSVTMFADGSGVPMSGSVSTVQVQPGTRGWWLVNPTEEDLLYGTPTKAALEHKPVPASFAQVCTDAADGTALPNALCAALNLPPGTMWGVYPAMTTVSVPEPVIVPATTAPREEEC